MSLENYTRRVRNETLEDLALLTKSIERIETTIERLRSSKSGFNPKTVIERNQAEMARLRSEQQALELKLEQIDNGLYEEKMKEELEHNRELIEQKTLQTKRKKESNAGSAPTNSANKPTNKHYPYYQNRSAHERDFAYAEKQFYRDVASLPDHLADKLKNMPANLGYIWKDIWFFGIKPAEQSNEFSLFEKQGGRFLTHVYNQKNKEYRLYEKDQSGRRHLLERKALQSLQLTHSLGHLLRKGFADTAQ